MVIWWGYRMAIAFALGTCSVRYENINPRIRPALLSRYSTTLGGYHFILIKQFYEVAILLRVLGSRIKYVHLTAQRLRMRRLNIYFWVYIGKACS